MLMRTIVLAGVVFIVVPGVSRGDPLRDEVEQLRLAVHQEITALKAREQQLDRELLRVDRRDQRLQHQLKILRAAKVGRPVDRNDTAATVVVAQAQPQLAAATPGRGPQRLSAAGETAPIVGPPAKEQQARRALELATPVSSTGGILTPEGEVIITPSLGYDYTTQNQFGVNGFQIIPGITFGNISVNRVDQDVVTTAVTARLGLTDRLELNVRVPYLYNTTTTTSSIASGSNAQQLSTNASNLAIGDIQAGASYQINAGLKGWPILIGNLTLKSATGVSPYDVPIYTTSDPNGGFLAGIQRRTPTGTGFTSLSPSLTVIYPTAPGVLFANLLYSNSLDRRVRIRSASGGPALMLNLTPGQIVGLTAGIGFALNDRASLSLSYQQQHVFEASENGQALSGSAYDFGSFNFGIGYDLSDQTRIDANVAVGLGPNAPAARLLIEVPYRFSL